MKIALLGHGTVGSGVYDLIKKNQLRFKDVYGQEVSVVCILVNHIEKYKHLTYNNLFTTHFDEFKELDIDVAIETIGGIEPAFHYVSHFLSKGIPVITSNKDLIAEKGDFLTELAMKNNTRLCYEASVGGGIPIIKPLSENLAGDKIVEIAGIFNGTTNYILTKMSKESLSYDKALLMAQKLGFAEADPTSDVEGFDSVRKTAILTKVGLNVNIDWKTIPVLGITKIATEDIGFFNQEHLTIKLLGITKLTHKDIYCSVRPVLVNHFSKFSSINDEFNGIRINGESVGELFFIGKGAGQMATATSVLGDLIDIIINTKIEVRNDLENRTLLKFFPDKSKWILKISGISSKELNKNIQIEFNECLESSFTVSENTHFIKIGEINEESLLKKLDKLSNSLSFDYKYYLIFD